MGRLTAHRPGSQGSHWQEKVILPHPSATPPSTAHKPPPPGQPYQSKGTIPVFFRSRSTTEGGALNGATPKLKSSFKGVKTGGIWFVLCEAEKQAQNWGWGQGRALLGCLAWALPISLQGGLALQTSRQSLPLQAPPGRSKNLEVPSPKRWKESSFLRWNLVLGCGQTAPRTFPVVPVPLSLAQLTCAGWALCR